MRDRDLYAKLLGIEAPWYVRDVDARLDAGEVEIFISFEERAEGICPTCGASSSKYVSNHDMPRELLVRIVSTLTKIVRALDRCG